jgi:AraC family transcriptional regulator
MKTIPNFVAGNQQHQTGLDRVRAYIRDHYPEELNISDLAKLAGLSKAHFHRVFHETYGETLQDHIRRIRLEKAACRLLAVECDSITEVAYACGFSSSQSFTRAFKAHYGIPPTRLEFNLGSGFILLKKWQNMQTHYGVKYLLSREVRPDGTFIQIPSWTSEGKDFLQDLEVMDMPSLRVAYVRTITDPGSIEPLAQAMNHLVDWALPKGLIMGDCRLFRAVETIPDEDGRITVDASISAPEGIDSEKDNGISIRYLPAGEYGVYCAKVQSVVELHEAWKRLICGWWISSYSLRERRPFYEIYYNNAEIHPTKSSIIDLCLPITTRCKK